MNVYYKKGDVVRIVRTPTVTMKLLGWVGRIGTVVQTNDDGSVVIRVRGGHRARIKVTTHEIEMAPVRVRLVRLTSPLTGNPEIYKMEPRPGRVGNIYWKLTNTNKYVQVWFDGRSHPSLVQRSEIEVVR